MVWRLLFMTATDGARVPCGRTQVRASTSAAFELRQPVCLKAPEITL